MKICVACSAGGHLIEALQLTPVLNKYNHFFLTFKRKQSEELLRNKKIYFVIDPKRNPIKFFLNFLQSLKIFLKEKPNVIISTGAAPAVPTCYLGKLFGSKIIYIETLAATEKPSLAGRFIYPIADLFLVQWKKLLKFYKRATYRGKLI